MTRRFQVWLLIPSALVPLVFAAAAHAAEAANPQAESLGIAFKWVHFAILALLLVWLFGFRLPGAFFKPNADRISEAIVKATALKVEADRQLREAAVKLTSLDEEISAFRAAALKDSAAEIERLRAATRSEGEKIKAAAKAEIAAAERAARIELKDLAGKLAVDKAEALVAEQMTPVVQDALVRNFVESLRRRPN